MISSVTTHTHTHTHREGGRGRDEGESKSPNCSVLLSLVFVQSDRELEAVRSTLAQNPPAELSSLRGEVATLQSQLSSLRSEVRFDTCSQRSDE